MLADISLFESYIAAGNAMTSTSVFNSTPTPSNQEMFTASDDATIWADDEFKKLWGQLAATAPQELHRHIIDQKDMGPVDAFAELTTTAFDRAVNEMTKLSPKDGAKRLNQILQQLSAAVVSAGHTTRRLPLDMPQTRKIIEHIRRLFGNE